MLMESSEDGLRNIHFWVSYDPKLECLLLTL